MNESPTENNKMSPSGSKALSRADKINEMRKQVASVSEEDKKMFDAVSGAIVVIQHFVLSVILKYAQLALRVRRLEKEIKKFEEKEQKAECKTF